MSNETGSSGPGGSRAARGAVPHTCHTQRAAAVSNGGSVDVLPNGPGDTENPEGSGPGDQGEGACAGRDQVIDPQAHECVGGAGWHEPPHRRGEAEEEV